MSSSALTASVWGKGRQNLALRPLRPGEEECMICHADVPAVVRLKGCPCNGRAAVCLACVESLRAANIFKANKGVSCPLCRGFIESYELIDRNDPNAAQLQSLLAEANRAARVASAARAGTGSNRPDSATDLASGRVDWACTACCTSNAWWATRCTECDSPGPNPAPVQSTSISITEDIRQQMQTLHHPTLQKAFAEIAVPLTQNQVGQFSENKMMASLKTNGAKKLLNLVRALSDPAFFRDCATHIHANFTVQNLIQVLARIHILLASKPPNVVQQYLDIERFKQTFRGLDPFAVLLYTMLPMVTELAMHTQGTFVAQKLIQNVGNEQEVLDVCRAVLPDTVLLMQDSKGKFAVMRTVEVLEDRRSKGSLRHGVVARGINFAAKAFLPQFQAAKFATGNHFGARVVSSIVSMGIPCFESLDLCSRLATEAQDLLTKRGKCGYSVLLHMIQSKGGPGCLRWYSEHMRDLLCIITMQLLDVLPALVMSKDPEEVQLVKELVIRLAEEQEVQWIEEIIGDFINRGDELAKHPPALDVLVTALSVDVLSDDDVHLHLLQLRQLIGNAVYPIANRIEAMRGQDMQMPPPRYHEYSAIQPSLRWWLLAGNKPPVPPPPPSGRPPARIATPPVAAAAHPPATLPVAAAAHPTATPPVAVAAHPPAAAAAAPRPVAAPGAAPLSSAPKAAPAVQRPTTVRAPAPPTPPAMARPPVGGLPPGFAMPMPMPVPVGTGAGAGSARLPTAPATPGLLPQPHAARPAPGPASAAVTPHATPPGHVAVVPTAVPTAASMHGAPPQQPRHASSSAGSAGVPVVTSYPPPPPPLTSISPTFLQNATPPAQAQAQHYTAVPLAYSAPYTLPLHGGPAPRPTAPAPSHPAYNARLLPYAIPVGAPPPANGFMPSPPPPSSSAKGGNGTFMPRPAAAPAVPSAAHMAVRYQQAPQQTAAAPSPPHSNGAAARSWQCKVCTYLHENAEAEFLSCALCGTLNE